MIPAAARNLGVMMRRLFGVGTPRSLPRLDVEAWLAELRALWRTWVSHRTPWTLSALYGSQLFSLARSVPTFRTPPPRFAAAWL